MLKKDEEIEILINTLKDNYKALFLLLKRVTKLGEIQGEPDSPIDLGWKACDSSKKLLQKYSSEE